MNYQPRKEKKKKKANLDKNEVIRLLDNCLLSDIDMLQGEDLWLKLPDPFPAWGESS